MKKNDWVLLTSVLLYSFLFYHQAAGINFLIFNVVLIAGTYLKNKDVLKDKNWIIAAAGALISSVCIAIYSSPLAIITNIFSLGILSVMSFSSGTSLFVALFLTACSVGSSCVFMFLDMLKRKKNSAEKENKKPLYVKVLMFFIVAVIVILFFTMYQNSNPLFKDFTKNINLDFISMPWIFFTLGGLLLVYGFYYNRHLGILTSREHEISNNINKEEVTAPGFLNRLFKEDTEFVTATILFALLNVLLLVLNALDLNFLWFDGKLPEGIQHKEFVHDGVGTLIASIIFAIIIILYFFRGRLNYNPKNKTLRVLTYVWIIQNAFMIFSTAYRMNMYVSESGISYKKIGVYVYLMLTLIGLITTYIKVSKQKSNWFLIRVNPQAYYAIMVLACTINWDVIITRFNINKAVNENKSLEKYYLVDLSFKNLPELLMLNDTIKSYDDYEARDYYFASRGTYFYSFKSALDKKLYDFLDEYAKYNSWRSWSSEKQRVYNQLIELNASKSIKSIQLSDNYSISTLVPLKDLTNIEILELNNSYLRNLDELGLFPALKKLSIGSNQIDSLDKLPVLKNLEDLNLSGNWPYSLSPLKNAPNLKVLNLQSISKNEISSLPELKHLAELNLSINPLSDFEDLNKYSTLEKLEISNCFKGNLDSFPLLPNLRYLDISANEINSSAGYSILNKISSSAQLNNLVLSNNKLSNLYCMIDNNTDKAIFQQLESLDLSHNKLNNLSGIGVHTQLKELYLSSNEIRDISPILKLRNLKNLGLQYNLISSLEGINQLSELEFLNLDGCQLRTGYAALIGLNKLKDLNLSSNYISNIEPITQLSGLIHLNLSGNNLKSIAGLEKLKLLEELNISANQINDFTPLYKLKRLKQLYLGNINKADLDKLKKELPDCKITHNYYPSGSAEVAAN